MTTSWWWKVWPVILWTFGPTIIIFRSRWELKYSTSIDKRNKNGLICWSVDLVQPSLIGALIRMSDTPLRNARVGIMSWLAICFDDSLTCSCFFSSRSPAVHFSCCVSSLKFSRQVGYYVRTVKTDYWGVRFDLKKMKSSAKVLLKDSIFVPIRNSLYLTSWTNQISRCT